MITGKKVKEGLSKGNFAPAKSRSALLPGQAVRIARELQGWTQSELARRADLTQATVSAIEKGRVNLGVDRAKALARVLRVHPAVLLFPSWDVEKENAA